jgi:son of sevenless-like protein
MSNQEAFAPLTINTKANTNGRGGVFTAATFQYTEGSSQSSDSDHGRVRRWQSTEISPRMARGHTGAVPAPYGATAPPPGMYVRALYDYTADDRTSLSFRQGDTIQVITQLASGWWDGVINGVRGWFPSNYCAVISGPDDAPARAPVPTTGDVSEESGNEEEFDEYDEPLDHDGGPRHHESQYGLEDPETRAREEAAFWIPQATPDGRLFYFNTLTGVSTMELPMETPTSANETGPHDRMNVNVPDQTRPPPEMIMRGYVHHESDYDDSGSVSEFDGESDRARSRGIRRRSYISDGVSPAASIESLDTSVAPHRNPSSDVDHPSPPLNAVQHVSASMTTVGSTNTSFIGNPMGPIAAAVIPRSFFDDGNTAPMTWNKLVENMRKSVESYRQAINNADRSEYVRKAEDISDHLRMLLAAASGTTDNHSGNPSIISTNKALYPHFRDMMSRFSKLVLSSHIASADWPAPDSYTKCLQEAEGVLHGVYGFVEVARSQRGEEIPRVVPGFVLGSDSGGNWQNNGLGLRDPMLSVSFMDQDEYEPYSEPTTPLDADLLERMENLKRVIVGSIRRLEEHLTMTEKLVSLSRHEEIGNAVCGAATKVIEFLRPWLGALESINLAPLGSSFPNQQLIDFSCQKQRLYDLVVQLLMACQNVAAPLGDEWAEVRGDPLEDRLTEVRAISRALETCTSQIWFSLELLNDTMPQESNPQHVKEGQPNGAHQRADGGASHHPPQPPRKRAPSEFGHYPSYSDGIDPATGLKRRDNSKVKKFFGEDPGPPVPIREPEETPAFLRLDYEGEISYDMKINPPQLRGGTLIALVEQLTRHDRLDSPFNNTFLLTYRSFTTASELFELLVKRFSVQPPRGISEDDYKTWVDKKQKPIRFRVVNILKSWFDHYWMENADEASDRLLRRVYSFAKESIATTSTPGSGPLMIAVEQRLKGQDTNAKIMVPTPSASIPTPIIPKNLKKLKFLDIDATEFARQLTIIESRLYGKIKPTECLNKTWQKKVTPDEPDLAPNVKALILHSNQLTNWVAEMILTQSDIKKRVVVIKHFVLIADVGSCFRHRTGGLLISAEMPIDEQLLHFNVDHIGTWHGTDPPTEPDVGPSQRSNNDRLGADAKVDGQYEEFWRISRYVAPG